MVSKILTKNQPRGDKVSYELGPLLKKKLQSLMLTFTDI